MHASSSLHEVVIDMSHMATVAPLSAGIFSTGAARQDSGVSGTQLRAAIRDLADEDTVPRELVSPNVALRLLLVSAVGIIVVDY